ncbi:DOMON domain protein [Cooperia oncophora]
MNCVLPRGCSDTIGVGSMLVRERRYHCTVVSDGNVTVEFENRKVTNDQWTGIAFGRDMNDLEVVVVKIQDDKPTLATGFTAGYEAPTLDSVANVEPELLSFQDGKLTLHFTRPLGDTGARNHSLERCQTWSTSEISEYLRGYGNVRKVRNHPTLHEA